MLSVAWLRGCCVSIAGLFPGQDLQARVSSPGYPSHRVLLFPRNIALKFRKNRKTETGSCLRKYLYNKNVMHNALKSALLLILKVLNLESGVQVIFFWFFFEVSNIQIEFLNVLSSL